MKPASEFLPWPHDALDAAIGKAFQACVADHRIDHMAIAELAEFVRDHRKRCADYDASKTMIDARIRTARANPGAKWDGIASSGNQWGD